MPIEPTTDFSERPSAPALTMIGYIRAVINNDKKTTDIIEESFDSTYMCAGGLQIAVLVAANYTDNPAGLYELVRDTSPRRPLRRRDRAARDFLGNLIDSLDEYEMLEEISGDQENGPTFDHRDIISKYPTKHLVRGIGVAVADIVLFTSYLHSEDPDTIIDSIYSAYLNHEAGQ